MIEQRLMKPGQWDLALTRDTPKSIRDLLQPFGHIVVLESRLDPRVIADADVKSNALYVGIMRRRPTPFTMAGAGLVAWLGDEEGKGDLFEANLTLTAQTFVQSVTAVLPAAGSIVAGTISAIGVGTVTQSFFIANGDGAPRTMLDWLMKEFGGEYRVNNNGTLDAGLATTLFKSVPGVILLADDPEAGRDLNIVGIPASTDNLETDADSQSTRVWYAGASSSNATANFSPAPGYKDSRGNTAKLTRVVVKTSTAAANVAAQAAAEVALYPLRQMVTLASDRADVARDVQPGDWIYVYDPINELIDATIPPAEVHYGGRALNPLTLRVYALTWPVEAGMGVHYRDLNGVYTDLSPWVAWESPGTTFEVGAPLRMLTP